MLRQLPCLPAGAWYRRWRESLPVKSLPVKSTCEVSTCQVSTWRQTPLTTFVDKLVASPQPPPSYNLQVYTRTMSITHFTSKVETGAKVSFNVLGWRTLNIILYRQLNCGDYVCCLFIIHSLCLRTGGISYQKSRCMVYLMFKSINLNIVFLMVNYLRYRIPN